MQFDIPDPRIPNPDVLARKAKTFAVGGCVRDMVMGLEPTDYDFVVVGATPQDMLDAGLEQVGASFPVFLNSTGVEFALARTERKEGNGYSGFVTSTENVTLEEDLQRRDLTINALAFDMQERKVVDMVGGLKDIEDKVLRMTNPKAFVDDPLRAIRLARFSARLPEFSIDPATVEAVKSMPDFELEFKSLAVERINAEFEKMWEQSKAPARFFELLREWGILNIIAPHIDHLANVREPLEHHPEGNTFAHTMLALNRAKEINCNVDEFWMVLAHDIGKLDTGNSETHVGHEKYTGLVEEFCRSMKLTADQTFLCMSFARNHMRMLRFTEMRPYKIAQMLDEFRATHTRAITISMAVCAGADALGRAMETYVPFTLYDVEMALEAFRKVTGNDLIQACVASGKPVPKGKKFGQRLNEMRATAIKKALGRQ